MSTVVPPARRSSTRPARPRWPATWSSAPTTTDEDLLAGQPPRTVTGGPSGCRLDVKKPPNHAVYYSDNQPHLPARPSPALSRGASGSIRPVVADLRRHGDGRSSGHDRRGDPRNLKMRTHQPALPFLTEGSLPPPDRTWEVGRVDRETPATIIRSPPYSHWPQPAPAALPAGNQPSGAARPPQFGNASVT